MTSEFLVAHIQDVSSGYARFFHDHTCGRPERRQSFVMLCQIARARPERRVCHFGIGTGGTERRSAIAWACARLRESAQLASRNVLWDLVRREEFDADGCISIHSWATTAIHVVVVSRIDVAEHEAVV